VNHGEQLIPLTWETGCDPQVEPALKARLFPMAAPLPAPIRAVGRERVVRPAVAIALPRPATRLDVRDLPARCRRVVAGSGG
jgi:hypothetical protein